MFCQNLFEQKDDLLAKLIGDRLHQESSVRCSIFVDNGVSTTHQGLNTAIAKYFDQFSETIELAHKPFVLNGGEVSKHHDVVYSIHQHLLAAGIDRHCVIIVIGGGAVVDAVGYAAATFHRGVPIIRMPSTVLGQNDAGVGVKNAINALSNKNLIGTFAPPLAVINDAEFLKTLSERDIRAGLAEAIKVALIKSDTFFLKIEETASQLLEPGSSALFDVIHECAQLHINQITQGEILSKKAAPAP